MQANETPTWIGWHRPSSAHPWRICAEADSEADCRDLLETRFDGGEMKVLPAGKHPLDRVQEQPP